jgi:N-dimethylarginine dimethylaminohydrolase
MCPPDNFDVVDVKNPHMEGKIGTVDKTRSHDQWESLRLSFLSTGATIDLIAPLPGCEDMVFCANQTLVGLDPDGRKLCMLSHMKHASRQREVIAFSRWFAEQGYRVLTVEQKIGFEGSGDAIWHPGRGLIWGGYGYRTEPEIYPLISEAFGVPVIRLRLRSDRFYHLDTCFCAIDENTVLISKSSFEDEGLELIRSVFDNVIECSDQEANFGMACNATAIGGKHVIIQKGNDQTVLSLTSMGYNVEEVDTSEFLKSGGSVFCMKMYVF